MKTAVSTPPGHGGPHQFRTSKTNTPLSSPRMLIHSVGQAYPPKVSPKHSPGAMSFHRQSPCHQSPGIAQESRSASSPSYFGLAVEPIADPRESAVGPRENWNSPSSSVKSFATAIPKQFLPLDANSEYDNFRRQADANYLGKSFSLGSPQFAGGWSSSATPFVELGSNVAPAAFARLQSPRRVTQDSGPTSSPYARAASPAAAAAAAVPVSPETCRQSSHGSPMTTDSQMDVDMDSNSLYDSACVSTDTKHGSVASIEPQLFPNMPPSESPVQIDTSSEQPPALPQLRIDEHRHPRFPMGLGRHSIGVAKIGSLGAGPSPVRAETAPATINSAEGMMEPRQLKEIMDLHATAVTCGTSPQLLLIDVRVATFYATSRIRGALNMCIPTTLLKRATFNLEKMQLTFAKDEDQASFSAWRDAPYLVVYDNSSAEKRDALAALNMLRKFTNEGYKGHACILRGGFKTFAEEYPNLIDRNCTSSPQNGSPSLSLPGSGPRKLKIAPIIGGVMLPATNRCPNPFFSSIRQNTDLADGVGRIELALPAGMATASLPTWLRNAADPGDHGTKVSEKFLQIELAEQARMKDAYGAFNPSLQNSNSQPAVQISGVEKGGKNRYKDILPFEHARVRLQGRAPGACDYVNASHLRASRSNKRYIASQAPLPDTFADFWSVIWDEDVRVIVMLTAESEGGQLKCHPYWKDKEYGSLKLRLLSEKKVSLAVDKYRSSSTISGSLTSPTSSASNSTPPTVELRRRRAHTLVPTDGKEGSAASAEKFQSPADSHKGDTPFVFIRKFALSHERHPFAQIREVTQLHYPLWPDFGTPALPSHLLALVELANVMQRAAAPFNTSKVTANNALFPGDQAGSSTGGAKVNHLFSPWHDEPEPNPDPRPMLVHCSAGCGRTGTFCTVDAVLDMVKRQNQRSIKRANAAVDSLRQTGRRQSDIAPNDPMDTDVAITDTEPAQNDVLSRDMALDSDMDFDPAWLDTDVVDLIAGTVEDFRTQRLSMVQTLRQYVLCYETIAEWVSKMQERRGGSPRDSSGRARSGSMRVTHT